MHRTIVMAAALISVGVCVAPRPAAAEAPPAPGLGALAEDVAVVRDEVAELRAALAETLAELRARDEAGARPMTAPSEPTDSILADREAALDRLGARLDAIAAAQRRLAEQVRIAAEAEADASSTAERGPASHQPGHAAERPSTDREAEGDPRRPEAAYTRYTPGYTSGYHTVRAIPTRTTGPLIHAGHHRDDSYGYGGRRIWTRGRHASFITRRAHYHHVPFHHRTVIHRRHRQHSGITLGTTGGDFFFKLRLGHSVHVNHGY